MTFRNAYYGVKKIFTAELLSLIGSACLLVAAVIGLLTLTMAVSGAQGGAVATGVGTIILTVAGIVLPIIGFIMNLVGLRQAGKDEDYFRTAFIVAIFALVIRFVAGLFSLLNSGGGIADNISNTVSGICEIIVVVFVVTGASNLAERLGKSSVIGTGSKFLMFFIITYSIAILADLIIIFFGVNETVATIEGILGLVHAIFSLIAYIVYLVFLGKAKAMLRDN